MIVLRGVSSIVTNTAFMHTDMLPIIAMTTIAVVEIAVTIGTTTPSMTGRIRCIDIIVIDNFVLT